MALWPFKKKSVSTVPSGHNGWGWGGIVREPFTTAWQQNKELLPTNVRQFFAIYSCTTLISADISKLQVEVKRRDSNKVWETVENKYSKLLDRPNRYQNGIQFIQWWITSKLTTGNTYVLKQRSASGIEALYILDPEKVLPLIADDGSVYYQLSLDTLTNVKETTVVVPASEIIHDRYQPQFHPLIGISPIYAAALAGALGKKIQEDSHKFFANGASPGGILSAPGAISKDTAETLKAEWQTNYSGENAGRVAVVGDGLRFEPMRAKSVDSQLVEQLKLSADIVASCFHVPPFKIGMGTPPTKPQDGNLIYYSDCLQVLIEELEACLDHGLELSAGMRTELDTDDLLRMDAATIIDTLAKGVGGSIYAPNEARRKAGLKPLEGGDSIYMQQQNYSLEALAKRDSMTDPFNLAKPEPITEPEPIDPLASISADELEELLND